jgi:hypothetical protein
LTHLPDKSKKRTSNQYVAQPDPVGLQGHSSHHQIPSPFIPSQKQNDKNEENLQKQGVENNLKKEQATIRLPRKESLFKNEVSKCVEQAKGESDAGLDAQKFEVLWIGNHFHIHELLNPRMSKVVEKQKGCHPNGNADDCESKAARKRITHN